MEGKNKMAIRDRDSEFLKEFQERFEKKIKEHEITTVKHWKEYLDKLISLKPEGIASLKLEMKKLSDMMENRIKILKRD